ncbi:hypothetical protein V6N11_032786 [Hibiscus sabdariffa]|uniref:Uncharacterized protein n=1 Tax=Hibiscus sabdariffa TaxID=183260 RepID=A0ABR2T2H2_9ROSI
MGGLFLALLSFDFPSLPALTPVDGSSPLEATLLEPEKQAKKLVKTVMGNQGLACRNLRDSTQSFAFGGGWRGRRQEEHKVGNA